MRLFFALLIAVIVLLSCALPGLALWAWGFGCLAVLIGLILPGRRWEWRPDPRGVSWRELWGGWKVGYWREVGTDRVHVEPFVGALRWQAVWFYFFPGGPECLNDRSTASRYRARIVGGRRVVTRREVRPDTGSIEPQPVDQRAETEHRACQGEQPAKGGE